MNKNRSILPMPVMTTLEQPGVGNNEANNVKTVTGFHLTPVINQTFPTSGKGHAVKKLKAKEKVIISFSHIDVYRIKLIVLFSEAILRHFPQNKPVNGFKIKTVSNNVIFTQGEEVITLSKVDPCIKGLNSNRDNSQFIDGILNGITKAIESLPKKKSTTSKRRIRIKREPIELNSLKYGFNI